MPTPVLGTLPDAEDAVVSGTGDVPTHRGAHFLRGWIDGWMDEEADA